MLSRIIVAALLIASVIFAAVRIYWPDIIAQPPSAAAFLGALAGAGGGLLAIIFGALVNAELNRRRDDRLRDESARTMAIAFRAELWGLMSDTRIRLHTLKNFRTAGAPIVRINTVQLDISAKPVYANNTHWLGGLGDRVALSVVEAHRSADHIRHNVAALLAHPPDAMVGKPGLEVFRKDFRSLIEDAAKAVNALDAFLGDPERYPDPEALAAEMDPAGPGTPEVTPELAGAPPE